MALTTSRNSTSRGLPVGLGDKEKLVEIRLHMTLILKLRGTKPPSLLDCECEIPSLRETDENFEPAESLNHAYRLISTAFEPHRRSFGGSVFLKILIPPQAENDKWTRLGDLRQIKIQEYYEQLKEKYQELKKEKGGQ